MALFLDGPLPLEDTITFVQEIPLPSNLGLTQMFPSRTYTTDEIDFAIIQRTNRAAKFRNWDGSYWVSPRDTGSEKRVRMLPLGGQLGVGEYERRQQEYSRVGGTIQNILVDAIYNDLENLTRAVQNRVELAWGDVLTDGVLSIDENGVKQELDYVIPADQVVTAGTLWSDTDNSDPLADMLAWYDVWVALNGQPPGRTLMSLTTARQLQVNKSLIYAIKGQQTGVTHVTLDDISGLLANYQLPPVTTSSIYNSFFDVDGVTTRPIPENRFLFLPDDMSTLGFTAWGTPTTVMELNANNVQVQEAAGIIGILVREDQPPFQKRTFVDAIALPVLADPRKILTATVA
ncbi:MAG TPA: major capsid protein [Galbitalea sp.]|nr:major capsid protein [Galbitalea sp.]